MDGEGEGEAVEGEGEGKGVCVWRESFVGDERRGAGRAEAHGAGRRSRRS